MATLNVGNSKFLTLDDRKLKDYYRLPIEKALSGAEISTAEDVIKLTSKIGEAAIKATVTIDKQGKPTKAKSIPVFALNMSGTVPIYVLQELKLISFKQVNGQPELLGERSTKEIVSAVFSSHKGAAKQLLNTFISRVFDDKKIRDTLKNTIPSNEKEKNRITNEIVSKVVERFVSTLLSSLKVWEDALVNFSFKTAGEESVKNFIREELKKDPESKALENVQSTLNSTSDSNFNKIVEEIKKQSLSFSEEDRREFRETFKDIHSRFPEKITTPSKEILQKEITPLRREDRVIMTQMPSAIALFVRTKFSVKEPSDPTKQETKEVASRIAELKKEIKELQQQQSQLQKDSRQALIKLEETWFNEIGSKNPEFLRKDINLSTEEIADAIAGRFSRDQFASVSEATGGKTKSPSEFVKKMFPIAQEVERQTEFKPIITITQSAHESGWGSSELASTANNLFGIKAKSGQRSVTLSTAEYVNGKRITVDANFRAYENWTESVLDWVDLISRRGSGRYRDAIEPAKSGDVLAFGTALQEGGYATDPSYAKKLVEVSKTVRNLLNELNLG